MTYKYKHITHKLAEEYLDSISPIYEESRLMQAIQDAIARSSLNLKMRVQDVVNQFFPQTCTFTIDLWEESVGIKPDNSKTLAERRAAVLSRRVRLESLTPERLAAILTPLVGDGRGVVVEEGIGKHTFRVSVVSGDTRYSQRRVIEKIEEVKPSHKSYQIGHIFPTIEVELEGQFIAQKFRPKYAGEIACGQFPYESTRPIVVESELEVNLDFINSPNRYLFPGERFVNEPNLHNTLELEKNYDMIIDQGSATDTPEIYLSGGEINGDSSD